MGLYDRDYYRDERSGMSLRAPRTVVGWLVLFNVAIAVVDGLLMPETRPGGRWLTDHMAVYVNAILPSWDAEGGGLGPSSVSYIDTLTQPWLWWQFITYAFAHDPRTIQHVAFNMLALFFLGRDVETAYGRKEFLRIYLATAIFAAVVWAVTNKMLGTKNACVYGASGAIAGIVVLYALNFPHRTLLLFFVLPIPAWFFGILVVALDMYGALAPDRGSNVAYAVHLAGAGFALVYYHQQWNLTRLTNGLLEWFRARSRPKLRVHQPEEPEADIPHGDLAEEVDRILEKIYREGESSLTAKERRTLETASREFQRRGGRNGGRG